MTFHVRLVSQPDRTDGLLEALMEYTVSVVFVLS